MKTTLIHSHESERGGALLMAVIAAVILAGLAGTLLAVTTTYKNEHVTSVENSRLLYLAEAGLSDGIAKVIAGAPANVGTQADPVAFSNGGYWCTVVDNGDKTTTVTAYGERNGHARGIEAVMQLNDPGVYASALFAGNSSGDPLYDMKLGGKGVQADAITGNIYSGGDVVISGNAAVKGEIKASGTISGGTGTEGASLPIPDIAGMHYETNHDVDVAALFAKATYKSSPSLGGSAWQLPETSPAHIFRKNPSDRAANTSKTAKDDYFLEDPYEKVNSSSKVTWTNATPITLSGVGGKTGTNGSNLVYYIDGNLWIHNLNIYSFALVNSGPEDIRVTIVVKGNIYISDNILYQDPAKDGLAMIAIKDSKQKDSGNIYFGDPVFGTLEEMDSFMYAENDFLDTNLSASGSAKVTVNGNMTAGNQVKINRDFGTQHSKLTVNFDARVLDGAITLPGLPSMGKNGSNWVMASWHEVARL